MTPEQARARFAAGRAAVLGTVRPDGSPHLVPVTFALDGDQVLTAVDGKPKRGSAPLARLVNIRSDPRVSLLVQAWDEDWTALWWVRVDGDARVIEGASADLDRARALLTDKYPQYGQIALPGPVIIAKVSRWRWWSADT